MNTSNHFPKMLEMGQSYPPSPQTGFLHPYCGAVHAAGAAGEDHARA